jgi:hypothetical protein
LHWVSSMVPMIWSFMLKIVWLQLALRFS